MSISALGIIIRGCFRTGELAQGWDGSLAVRRFQTFTCPARPDAPLDHADKPKHVPSRRGSRLCRKSCSQVSPDMPEHTDCR